MKKIILPIVIAACAASAHAGVIFNDTFTSGTAADAGYYRFGTTATTLATDGTELDFNYNVSGTTSSRSGVIKSFSDQTLAVGDSITFSFTINSRTLANSENNAFRWAIGNLGNPSAVTGAPVTADLASASPFASGSREMYQFSASTGAAAGWGQFQTGSTSPVHTGGTNTAITGFTGPASIATSGVGSINLTIGKTVTGYSITQSAFGVDSSGTLTTGTDIFNTIAFSMNNAGAYSVALDNIQVSVVPEPTTFAMMLGGLGALILMRRRRA